MSDLNAGGALQRGQPAETRTTVPAVFLHTGWRSGGTWLWSQCRDKPGVRGFYEPLHEGIADLRAADIARLRPGAWRSSHGDTAPYFQEYSNLLHPGGRGVLRYQRRFAFDGFFLDPEADDPELEAYLDGLLDSQAALGRVAVLKFCRSLGRVGWLERRFPDALHAVVLRRPLAQWNSCRRLLQQKRNRYFTNAPILVLARNADHPWVKQVCDALGVWLPALHSTDMDYGMEMVGWHVRRLPTAELYRAFLAYWTVTAVSALRSEALVIDTALLADSDDHRAAVEAALAGKIGARIDLRARAEARFTLDGPGAPDMAAAHGTAAACVSALGHDLDPARLDVLMRLLDEPGLPVPQAGRRVSARRWPAQRPAGVARRAHTAVMVAFARMLQPLRRLHGDFVLRREQ